jgi:linear primary-alkylsulfatase
MTMNPRGAGAAITDQQHGLRGTLPISNTRDLDDAGRGRAGSRRPRALTTDDGHMARDNDTHDFIAGEAPDTVNPSLWRQSSTRVAIDGLLEVVPGLHQVRGRAS